MWNISNGLSTKHTRHVRLGDHLCPPFARGLRVVNLAPTPREVLRIAGWDSTPGRTIGETGVPAP